MYLEIFPRVLIEDQSFSIANATLKHFILILLNIEIVGVRTFFLSEKHSVQIA